MKHFYLVIVSIALSIASCKKTDTGYPLNKPLQVLLKDSLSGAEYATVDFSNTRNSHLPGSRSITRIGYKGKNILQDFILIYQDSLDHLVNGRIIHITGTLNQIDPTGKPSFNGSIESYSLQHRNSSSFDIINGHLTPLLSVKAGVNSIRVGMNMACSDCTIPEVIVSSSYRDIGISFAAWMNFLSMFGYGDTNDYFLIDYGFAGSIGGGGGPTPPDVATIDTESPETKNAIDPKKYADCFGQIPDDGATCSITISADLPVDGHPETFFNWTDRSPGHAFIELNKSNPYGTVQQDIGFYPDASFKVLTGSNIASKIVDDGGHEYQARYTITVTAAQFQAAINKLNTASSNSYNVSHYNCTDFALDVFNSAGGNLAIPHHAIPGFEIDGGSNTPQGLYEKISQLKDNGTVGTTKTNGKEYSGNSKGPCN